MAQKKALKARDAAKKLKKELGGGSETEAMEADDEFGVSKEDKEESSEE